MVTRRLNAFGGGLFAALATGLLIALLAACTRSQDQPDLDEVPKQVMDTLKARFPGAEIHKCSKEKEGDLTVYDFEFTQEGQKFEMDILEDGTVQNWEKEVSINDLPGAVRKAVETKYPNAALKEIMAITAVRNGKHTPEGYEIALETADREEVEITVAPDGQFLEDSGDEE